MRLGFPGRLAFAFTGLPAALLLSAILVVRVTPALLDAADVNIVYMSRGYHLPSYGLFFLLLALVATLWIGFARARRLRWPRPALWALLLCVPILGIGAALWMTTISDAEDERDTRPSWHLAGRLIVPALIGWFFVYLLTAGLCAILGRLSLDDAAGLLGATAFIGLPLATAFIAGFLAGRAGRGKAEAMSAAVMTLTAILTVLGFAMMEGVVCIAMAAPIVLVAALPAAVVGHWYSQRTTRASAQVQCVAWLTLAACAVGEASLPRSPLEDTVTTEVVIDANPAQVWAQLKDIRGLPAPTETLFVLGVAHPVETVVDGPGGVGAHRVCRLSTGDMTELISVWEPERELRFTVLDTPALMREATFFGRELDAPHLHGTYVGIEGGFRLEPLPGGRTRLTGTSRYELKLAPARYWNLWTREIVSQVQQRVMRQVKARAEGR